MQGLLPPETSRFDVVAAYYLIARSYHSGQWSQGYRKLSQCVRMGLGGNLDALDHDESARYHASRLLWTRKAAIRRW